MRIFYRRRRRRSQITKHYVKHKETARNFVLEKLQIYNEFYQYTFRRVSIRNTKSRWGSCSEHGNLNFSYKLLFLPEHLADYIIVHELCHLKELNHSPKFWNLVSKTFPDYREKRKVLKNISWKLIKSA
jgi:predicted metal-dependent hydrolase